ncbi:MAG: ATP-dependent RNA helicase RhlE, partial [Gammaproteobacteria bacterium]
MSFTSLGLSDPLLQAVAEKGYTIPSPIQVEAIPAVLSGKDVMAAAQTGTGKTAGFTLPLLQRLDGGSEVKPNHIRALELTPTRELAAQVFDSVATYGKHLSLKSGVVFGGVKINPQMMRLRGGIDILVATPGRLLDLYSQNAVKFADLEILVLDEADRMLDMGFIRDIRKIMALLPKTRQNLLFSATFSNDIRQLTSGLLNNPVQIEVSPRNAAAQSVQQSVYEVDKTKKAELLIHLVASNNWEQVLVFTRTKHGANRLVKKLEREGITASAI